MELYKGLPIRTVEAEDIKGVIHIFGVTTENVDYLINHYFNYSKNVDEVIEEFDNSYSYGVPQHIFEETDDEELIRYINKNIDNFFKEL